MSQLSRAHTVSVVVCLAEGEGLGDVCGVEVVGSEAGTADVTLRNRRGKRAGNETVRSRLA